MTVAVVINESTPCTPESSGTRNTSFLRYFLKDSILVVVKPILAVVSDVKIFPTIIVIIAHAHALPPSHGRGKASLEGDICECPIVVVAIQMAARALVATCWLQGGSVHKKNVRPAVIVVI